MFTCRVCKLDNFSLIEMKKERRLILSLRGICKFCNAEYEKLRVSRQKAEQNEKDYLTCNDCDRIFSKYNRGNPSGNNQITSKNPELYELNYKKLLNTSCPFCKNENIEKY